MQIAIQITAWLLTVSIVAMVASVWLAWDRHQDSKCEGNINWTPCSYDCYDMGGCENCSAWVEEWDEDYGVIGRWETV